MPALTRRRRRRTSRRSAGTGQRRGTGRRAAAGAHRSAGEPTPHGGRSPGGVVTPSDAGATRHHRGCPRVPLPSAYGAGVPGVGAVDLRAEQAEAPGVAEELGGGFQHPLAAGEIVLGVAIKVAAESGHAAPVPRLQPDVDACTWGVVAAAFGTARHNRPHRASGSHLHPTTRPDPGGRGGGGRARRAPASARCRRRLWGAAPAPRSPSHRALPTPPWPSVSSATPPSPHPHIPGASPHPAACAPRCCPSPPPPTWCR